MDPLSLLRRDPAGAGFAFGLLLAACFALVPAALPLLLAGGVLAVAARPGAVAVNGLGIGALVGLAAAKGLVETAGLNPRDGFTGAPWVVAVAFGIAALLIVAHQRLRFRAS